MFARAQFVPQECTRDTSGLLYFDLLSSKMYRCNGQDWQEWGYGTGGGDGFQYTALLKDAAASSSSSTAPEPPVDGAADGDDDDVERRNSNNEDNRDNGDYDADSVAMETTTASKQLYGKKRTLQCKTGEKLSII